MMHFSIQTHGLILSERLRRYAHQKLEFAFRQLDAPISSARISLFDTNGPLLGGGGKTCRIVVQIDSKVKIVLNEHGSSITEVVDRISDQLSRTICDYVDSSGRKASVEGRFETCSRRNGGNQF